MTRADHSRVARAFGRGLANYSRAARAQARIARTLTDMICAAEMPMPGQVFEFGCGTGFLTQQIHNRLQPQSCLINDLLPECRARIAPFLNESETNWTFTAGPVQNVDLSGQFDLIASASTIQWLDDLPDQIARFSQALNPGGWLALSGFGPNQFHELLALGSAAQAPSYVTCEDMAAMLPADMAVKETRQGPIRLAFSDGRSVLRHLRETGVNAQAGTPWTKARLTRFERDYRARFGRGSALPLTYDPVYLLAQKTA